jgi:DNA invertase Pin-like site-specific DNA recombinase
MISQRTRDALASAKARGVRLGGYRAQSDITKAEALQRAEGLRSVFEELSGLSARKAAEELNRRGISTAAGGK